MSLESLKQAGRPWLAIVYAGIVALTAPTPSIAQQAEDDFESFFGREFVRAYEKQIGLLNQPPAPEGGTDEPPADGA